jgi:hypothetical protein
LGDANRPHVAGSKRAKVDYRELLSAGDFVLFAKLRILRKGMAEREAVPAYALFTNEQLAEPKACQFPLAYRYKNDIIAIK